MLVSFLVTIFFR